MAAFKTTPVVIPQAHHNGIVLRFILTSGGYLLSPPAQRHFQLLTPGRDAT